MDRELESLRRERARALSELRTERRVTSEQQRRIERLKDQAVAVGPRISPAFSRRAPRLFSNFGRAPRAGGAPPSRAARRAGFAAEARL